MAAFVEYLVAHEALLRIAFIDLFEVGPGDGRAHDQVGRGLHQAPDRDRPAAPARPRGRPSKPITGALWAIISGYVANGRLARLPCLVDHLAFTVLAPYVGPKAAVEAIQAARKPLRSI